MLYSLVNYLEKHFDIPGLGMFQYLSFRSVMAIILALMIATIFGSKLIKLLRRKQIGEDIRELGLQGQMEKKGTPTMGGIIILLSILVPILLIGDLSNIYVWLMIISTIWLGILGFADDYIKVFRKNKNGLKGKFKIVGQVGLGVIVGTIMCFSEQVTVVDKNTAEKITEVVTITNEDGTTTEQIEEYYLGEKSTKTTIPFVKNN
jgi:phospho-N-acetylmuramoyl-pentapeptide-transferase